MHKPFTGLTVDEPVVSDGRVRFTYRYGADTLATELSLPGIEKAAGIDSFPRLMRWLAVVHSFGLFSLDYFGEIRTDFELSTTEQAFFEKLCFFGLAEFRVHNGIPVDTKTVIRPKRTATAPLGLTATRPAVRILLMNGGGKDGSVSAQLLTQNGISFSWFQRGDMAAQRAVVAAWDAPVLISRRTLDPKRKGRYKGHRPLSAALAITGIATALLNGYGYVVASNEASANEATESIDGIAVNHQYSKSLAFEQDLNALLAEYGIAARYFSILRPLHELQIAAFLPLLSDERLRAITSCNQGNRHAQWCMRCAKCAFVVLSVCAVSPKTADTMWGDAKAVINTPALLPFFKALIDPETPKPYECVGTLRECQAAAYLVLRDATLTLDPAVKQLFLAHAADEEGAASQLKTLAPAHCIPETFERILADSEHYLAGYATSLGLS